jgi:hypothetical protein
LKKSVSLEVTAEEGSLDMTVIEGRSLSPTTAEDGASGIIIK